MERLGFFGPRRLGFVTLLGTLGCIAAVACDSPKPRLDKNAEAKALKLDEPMRLHKLSDFAMVDQSGTSKSLKSLAGKPWVAAFFFTRCPTICPKLTKRMQRVQARAKSQGLDVNLVGFSVDPSNDTPEVLSAYSTEYGLDTSNWLLLTGSQAEVDKMAKSFKVGLSGIATEGADHLGITHSGHLLLVDSSGTLRGYYRSGDDDQIDRLLKELAQLQDGS